MKKILIYILISLSFLLISSKSFNKEQLNLLQLDWKFSGTYKMPNSQSTIKVPEDYALLMDKKEINKFNEINTIFN